MMRIGTIFGIAATTMGLAVLVQAKTPPQDSPVANTASIADNNTSADAMTLTDEDAAQASAANATTPELSTPTPDPAAAHTTEIK